jgi:hypothetical protein
VVGVDVGVEVCEGSSFVVVDGMLLDLYCVPRRWWCHGCVFERVGGAILRDRPVQIKRGNGRDGKGREILTAQV